MKSVIAEVNYKRGLAIFENGDGDYGWFEILDTVGLEKGDVIYGVFNELGETTITKMETDEEIDIFIEDYGITLKKAMEMIHR